MLNQFWHHPNQVWQKYRRSLTTTMSILAVSGVILSLRSIGALMPLELKEWDYLLRLQPKQATSDRITIVEISELDLQQRGEWPWQDQAFAQLIEIIDAADPAVIGIDKYLDIPVGSGRAELIAAQAKAGNVVNATLLSLDRAETVELPPDLAAVSSYGFVNVPKDAGEVVRRALLVADYESFAFTIAQDYLIQHDIKIIFDPDRVEFAIHGPAGKRVIPRLDPNYGGYHKIDANGYQVMLNYRGAPGSFRHVSAVDVLSGRLHPDLFRDRIVLIGITAISVNDFHPTPFSLGEHVMFGVEINAHIIDQILAAALDDRPFIQAAPDYAEAIWILVWTAAGAIAAALIPNTFKKLGVLVVLCLSLVAVVYLAFSQAWWLPFFPAILGLAIAHGLVITAEYTQSQADRQLLVSLFSRHVSSELVELIWQHRDQFLTEGRIVGQEVFVTVLFTDMRNFSTTAEVQPPHEVLWWLNEYLGTIATEVLAHGGMVDKYIGDSVMAVFGVPIPHRHASEWQQDADNAITAAISIGQKLQAMNQVWQAQGRPNIVTGIGVNSGKVIAGSIGSTARMEYSVVGDVVNIAARLENLNKQVDGGEYHILIGAETADLLTPQSFELDFVGDYALKGRCQETPVYRVLGHVEEATKQPEAEI
ncbi:adenylate/guanylate cyclase with Chase sensor [Thalassoporum mexicanum PCC 7367]|uniref:CHASE2 domain-containing protein n=1 Tax=Thalassoporum mexicanum TaxID=3457544 RepID=UPI00029F9C5B|nr:adenylate/guanylate cyclase domain-containing protein [Pseudanabaena sp. PCC 7367]AFY68562.1 adenylate/guanylate cyclase with Chase sensor [Pseudanabaena sp. PCC 7367]